VRLPKYGTDIIIRPALKLENSEERVKFYEKKKITISSK
jgi:hypothetical protein